MDKIIVWLPAPPPKRNALKEFKAAIDLLRDESNATSIGLAPYVGGLLYEIPENKLWAAELLGFMLWV